MKPPVELNRLGAVFRGADAGHYDLPGEVIELRRALDILSTASVEPAPDTAAVREQTVRDTIAAARAGKPLPDVTDLADLERRARLAGERAALHRESAERVGRELVAATHDLADTIVAEHLRPALTAVLAATAKASDALPAGEVVADALLRGPQKARDAWLSLEPLAARYGALRAAQAALPGPELDDEFRELRNHNEVWPLWRNRTNLQHTLRVPWPEDGRARMLWLVRSEAQPWMPTNAERDSRWNEVYGAAVARTRANRHQAEALLSLTGGRR